MSPRDGSNLIHQAPLMLTNLMGCISASELSDMHVQNFTNHFARKLGT
jgi:hypothetical protein